MRQLQEEIQILKRLNHHHTVRYMGSYTSPTVLGLIMTPIADLDLAQYLELANASDYVELRTFFGCLATGLDYLHQSMVRHKYIKSRNVRVHNGKVLFADFGLSLDFSEADGDTTVSMVNGMTPRYCAPEVADCLPRRKSADIWSLGVVFLEMTTILTGNDIDFMRNFFLTHGTEVDFVYKNIPGLSDHLAELRKLAPKQVDFPLQWIEGMLQVDPRDRPHAASLVDAILNARGDSGASDFCGMCCTREVEV
jgi:serine/threonine protein kinase